MVYVCRKLKLYNFLIGHGFVPFAIRQDKYCANRIVWLFDDNEPLRTAVSEYYSPK